MCSYRQLNKLGLNIIVIWYKNTINQILSGKLNKMFKLDIINKAEREITGNNKSYYLHEKDIQRESNFNRLL